MRVEAGTVLEVRYARRLQVKPLTMDAVDDALDKRVSSLCGQCFGCRHRHKTQSCADGSGAHTCIASSRALIAVERRCL
jgi:hypothetical protein